MDKIVTRDQMQTILDNRPKGVPMDAVIQSFTTNGYKVEGVNYEKPQTFGQKAAEVGGAIVNAPERLGLTIKNIAEQGGAKLGQALGGSAVPQTVQQEGIFGNNVDALGYRDGEALQGTELAKDIGGNVLANAANLVPGGAQLRGLSTLGKVAEVAKVGATTGALQASGTALQEGQSLVDSFVSGLKGGAAGAVLGGTAVGAVPAIKATSGAVAKGLEALTPSSEAIMQRVARISKGKQASFEKTAGESVGSYLDKRGIYGDEEQIVSQLYDRFTKSKQVADEAIASLPGTYQSEPVRTALTALEGKVKRTSSPGAPDKDFNRVMELVDKEKTEGLSMSEINEVKRIYERRVKLDFLRENNPESIVSANNIDDAMREWQFAKADELGLKNLPEINRETRLARQLMDDLGAESAGKAGNNAVGLTDWIALSGGDPASIAMFLTKKAFSSKTLQSKFAKAVSKSEKIGLPTAERVAQKALPAPTSSQAKQVFSAITMAAKTDTTLEKELIAQFGKNYEKANPVEMAKWFIERTMKAQLPALPAPAIRMNPAQSLTPKTQLDVLQADKGLVGVNPKTKQFMKTYKSTGTKKATK